MSHEVFIDPAPEEYLPWLRAAASAGLVVGLDTEFDGQPPEFSPAGRVTAVTIQLAIPSGHARDGRVHWRLAVLTSNFEALRPWLASPRGRWVAHFLSADAHALQGAGLPVTTPADTYTLTRFYFPTLEAYGLKYLARLLLGREPEGTFKERFTYKEAGKSLLYKASAMVKPGHVKHDEFLMYAADDALWVGELYQELELEHWRRNGEHVDLMTNPWVIAQRCLHRAETAGFALDMERLAAKGKQAASDMATEASAFSAMTAGANPNSPHDLLPLFYAQPFREKEERLRKKVAELRAELAKREDDYAAKVELWASEKRKVTPSDRAVVSFTAKVDEALAELGTHLAKGTHALPCPPSLAKGDHYTADAEALAWLDKNVDDARAKSVIRQLLAVRRVKSSLKYLDKLAAAAVDHDGVHRVHCALTRGTETGRLAAAKPELQQIPKDVTKDPYGIRECFVAAPGKVLVISDYNALEMRILAHELIERFGDHSLANDLEAEDCHSSNALRVFGGLPGFDYLKGVAPADVKSHKDKRVKDCRQAIKAVAYGLNYGKGASSLGATLLDGNGEPIGKALAEVVIENYMALYPGLARYQAWVREAVDAGVIHTWSGRSRPVVPDVARYLADGLTQRNAERAAKNAAWRSALNYPMQGGAADAVDAALILACERLEGLAVPIMQIHDELIFECDEAVGGEVLDVLCEAMQEAVSLRVPLTVDGRVGKSWKEPK